MERVPIILDTDIGDDVDDVFALLLAIKEPAVDLLGVTTVFGDVAQRSRIARKLLGLAGMPDLPVHTGCGITLDGRNPSGYMASGEGFAPARADTAPEQETAIAFLIDRILTAPEPITVVAVGPLTNIATALRQEPKLAHKMKALVIMGGRLGVDDHLGEHNVNSDVTASREVFASGANIVLGTYEVTRRARLGHTHLNRLALGDPACAAAAAMLQRYLQQMQRASTSMYDPLTLTAAFSTAHLTVKPARLMGAFEPAIARLVTAPNNEVASFPVEVSVDCRPQEFVEYLLATITEEEKNKPDPSKRPTMLA